MTMFVPENVRIGAEQTSKDAVLATVADFAVERGYAADASGVYDGLCQRENELSTALMDGIAIPHTKHEAVTEPALLILRLNNAVEWTGSTVTVALAMLVPAAEGGTTHLRLLAQVSRALMNEQLRETLNRGNADEIYQALSEKISPL